MLDLKIVLGILFIHWVCDFVLQTDWQAQNKSKRWDALLLHTGIYSTAFYASLTIFTFLMGVSIRIYSLLIFLGVTFICHTITDYFTSRVNSKLYANKQIHYFFVSVGFDQWLHYVQLFLTYYLLTK